MPTQRNRMEIRREARRRKRALRTEARGKTTLRNGGVPKTSYVPRVESKPGELLRKWDIINHLIKHFGYKRYLEIGVCGYNLHGVAQDCETFKRVKCETKFGIDPAFPDSIEEREELAKRYGDSDDTPVILYSCTSDYYFGHINWGAWESKPDADVYSEDLVFIDADHRLEQVMKDFKALISKRRVSDNGTIVFHDAYPDPKFFKDGHIIGGGRGSVWKMIAKINLTMPEWTVWTLALDGGMAIVRKVSRTTTPGFSIPLDEISIFDVSKYAKTLLNLITIDEFKEIFK